MAGTVPLAPRSDVGQAVRAFLDRYRERLAAGDAVALAGFYRTPLPVIRPDRLRVIETQETLLAELRMIIDLYRWSGMETVDLQDLRVDGFDPGLWIASFAWAARTAEGEPIARVQQSFTLRAGLDGFRIAAVIAHNEERERQPILRESLAAIGLPRATPFGLADGD
jgi:hypothetical protein